MTDDATSERAECDDRNQDGRKCYMPKGHTGWHVSRWELGVVVWSPRAERTR